MNKVTQEQVNDILKSSKFEVETWGDKTTIVKCVLPNGFILVESSSCVDPANYDQDLGANICYQKIEDKIWFLQGYLLQCSQK